MKSNPVKIQIVKKIDNVYVLYFPTMNITLTVNKYYYQRMLNSTEEFQFINPVNAA